MDEHEELERIQLECIEVCRYMGLLGAVSAPMRELEDPENLTWEEEVFVNRCALQLGQGLTFCGFITTMAERYLALIRKPEKAEEIGAEGLRQLHKFLTDYADILAEEYNWCKWRPTGL